MSPVIVKKHKSFLWLGDNALSMLKWLKDNPSTTGPLVAPWTGFHMACNLHAYNHSQQEQAHNKQHSHKPSGQKQPNCSLGQLKLIMFWGNSIICPEEEYLHIFLRTNSHSSFLRNIQPPKDPHFTELMSSVKWGSFGGCMFLRNELWLFVLRKICRYSSSGQIIEFPQNIINFNCPKEQFGCFCPEGLWLCCLLWACSCWEWLYACRLHAIWKPVQGATRGPVVEGLSFSHLSILRALSPSHKKDLCFFTITGDILA